MREGSVRLEVVGWYLGERREGEGTASGSRVGTTGRYKPEVIFREIDFSLVKNKGVVGGRFSKRNPTAEAAWQSHPKMNTVYH